MKYTSTQLRPYVTNPANIILDGKKAKAITSSLLFNIVLEVLAGAIRQDKERHPNQEEISKIVII